MTAILVVDSVKSSLVMTSEVFKDKIPGATIYVARSGEECLESLAKNQCDMVVVDFDLPDTDGITLTKIVRRTFSGPILITAFPEKMVAEAIEDELFAYNDSCDWIRKPVKFDDLAAKIDHYLFEHKRLRKRYTTDLGALLVGKGAGRGKRAPKIKGNIINLSIGGALVSLDDTMKMKIGDEITLTFHLPKAPPKPASRVSKIEAAAAEAAAKGDNSLNKGSSKIKAKIAWTNKNKKQAGILFEQLTDTHRKTLENVMKQSEEIS